MFILFKIITCLKIKSINNFYIYKLLIFIFTKRHNNIKLTIMKNQFCLYGNLVMDYSNSFWDQIHELWHVAFTSRMKE